MTGGDIYNFHVTVLCHFLSVRHHCRSDAISLHPWRSHNLSDMSTVYFRIDIQPKDSLLNKSYYSHKISNYFQS